MTNFAKEFKKIESWLKDQGIKSYTINTDLSIDVSCDVNLSMRGLENLPYQFGHIGGNFDSSPNQLDRFEFCPTHVGGVFFCHHNASLGDAQNLYDFEKILELHLQHVRTKTEKELLFSIVTPNHSEDLLLANKKHKI